MTDKKYVETGAVKLYARVQGNRVVEYPVTDTTIASRGHSVNQYHQVLVEELEIGNEPGKFIETKMTIEGRTVVISHILRDKTLEEAVFFFRKSFKEGVWSPFTVAEIPKAELDYFQKKLGEVAEDMLDAVVKERYSSLDTLLGRYANSTNPVWAKEAAFMQKALDALWTRLLAYFRELNTGAKPLPVDVESFADVIKPVSWADMV